MIRVVRNRIDGIAEPLPKGETVLWSGRPEAWRFARRLFRLQWVALWFLGLGLWRGTEAWQAGAGLSGALTRASSQLPFAFASIGLLAGLGIWMARSTTYALTQRRLVMNVGVALPITFNIPLRLVDGVAVRQHHGDLADLVLTLTRNTKASLPALWPHVRRLADTEVRPAFRDVSAQQIAILLPLLTTLLRDSEQEGAASAPLAQPLLHAGGGRTNADVAYGQGAAA